MIPTMRISYVLAVDYSIIQLIIDLRTWLINIVFRLLTLACHVTLMTRITTCHKEG